MNKSKMKQVLEKRIQKAKHWEKVGVRKGDEYQQGYWAGFADGL